MTYGSAAEPDSPNWLLRRSVGPSFALLALGSQALAQEVEIDVSTTRWRSTLEYLEADNDEEILSLGLHYDLLDAFELVPGSYVGIGGYTGLLGDRGGFAVGGLTLGWQRDLGKGYGLDLGTFVGAGGSDEGDWGGGLFVRPHVGIEKQLKSGAGLRLEVSHANVPGGDLESTQVAIGITNLDAFLTADWAFTELGRLSGEAIETTSEALSLSLVRFFPSNLTEFDTGFDFERSGITLAQIGYDQPLAGGWFLPLEVGAAVAGEVSGYLQALLGLGYRAPLFGSRVNWRLQGLVGGAGGGGLDTGGGLLTGGKIGLEGQAGERFLVKILGGYLVAPTGEFDGFTLEGGLSWAPRRLNPRPGTDLDRFQSQGLDDDDLSLDTWRLQLLHKSISPDSSVLLQDGSPGDEDIQLLGVGFQKPLSESFALALRAFGAWDGDVGGYREGQVGVLYSLPVLEPFNPNGDFYVSYFAGVGGGGGVDLGSGLFHQLGIGYSYRPLRNLSLSIEAATLDGPDGTFEGQSIGFGLTYDLTVPVSR